MSDEVNTQEFWCFDKGEVDYNIPCVKILIPTKCLECGHELIIGDKGCTAEPSHFAEGGMCEHFFYYLNVWERRILNHAAEYGAQCSAQKSTKCAGFYPDAEKKPGFTCFACRSGW